MFSPSSSQSWRLILWIFVLFACAELVASAVKECKACNEKGASGEISGESKCSSPTKEVDCTGHDPASCFAVYDKDNKMQKMGCSDWVKSGCADEPTEEGRYCYCDKKDECIPDPPGKGSGSLTKPFPWIPLVIVGLLCIFKGM